MCVAAGCGKAYEYRAALEHSAAMREAPSTADYPEAAEAKTDQSPNADETPRPPNVAALQRKIIYTATVDLVVESFDETPAAIEQLVRKHNGYVARSNIYSTPGRPRSGQWTVRIPVDQYEAFLQAARSLGEVRRIASDSKDVTEEYYDVDARLRNKKTEEKRLVQLLEDATGKLTEVLQVERELFRVRGEIERLEGRLRLLDNLAALTTVTISVEEIKGYQPEEAPSYGTEVRRAWQISITALVETGRALSIAAVAAAPWVVVLGVVFSPLFFWLRRAWKRWRARRVAQATRQPQ